MFTRFVAAVAITGVLAAQPSPLDAAWDLLAKGNREGALRILTTTLRSHPADGEARLMLGSIFAEDGKISDAIAQLTEAVRLLPRSAMAHNALGEAFKSAGDYKAARPHFETAVSIDSKFAQAHVNLGQILVQQGESDSAAKYLDRALAVFGPVPDAAYAQYLRAKIHTEQDQVDKAAALLKQAVSLQPDFAEAWSDLGQAKKALQDDGGAFAAFQRSVELSPENAISQYRLGAEYLRRGKAHDAVAHLQRSLQLAPENQSTLYGLQLALRQDGQTEEARRIKEKLAAVLRNIDQESQSAFNAIRFNNDGVALEKSGNLAAAVDKYRSAVAADPKHVGYRLNFAVSLLRLGRWQEGLAELRETLRRDPGNAQAEAALKDALEQAPVEFGGRGKKVGAER